MTQYWTQFNKCLNNSLIFIENIEINLNTITLLLYVSAFSLIYDLMKMKFSEYKNIKIYWL